MNIYFDSYSHHCTGDPEINSCQCWVCYSCCSRKSCFYWWCSQSCCSVLLIHKFCQKMNLQQTSNIKAHLCSMIVLTCVDTWTLLRAGHHLLVASWTSLFVALSSWTTWGATHWHRWWWSTWWWQTGCDGRLFNIVYQRRLSCGLNLLTQNREKRW